MHSLQATQAVQQLDRMTPAYLLHAIDGALCGRKETAAYARMIVRRAGLSEAAAYYVFERLADEEAADLAKADAQCLVVYDALDHTRSKRKETELFQSLEDRLTELKAQVMERWGAPEYAAMYRATKEFANMLAAQGRAEIYAKYARGAW